MGNTIAEIRNSSIVEAPNNETIAKVSIELGSRGTIKIVSMAAE